MATALKEKLSVKEKWIRLIFMVLFAYLVYWVALILVFIIAAFQFIYSLFAGTPNKVLLPFGESLSEYIHQIMRFLTYSSEEKPFPFKPWPTAAQKAEKITKPAAPKKKPGTKKAA